MINVERDMGRSLRILAVVAALSVTQPVCAGGDAADEAVSAIRPEAIRGDMRFLSDDLLEGRGTGTRRYELAAKFMATQFETLGLQPAGDAGTYFQSVRLRSMKADEARTTLTLTRAGKEETLAFREDYISHSDPGRVESSVEAGVVLVGFGVTAAEQSYDDYKGIDTKGKIVALTFGAPSFESSLKAHYSSASVKAKNAVLHGAIGIIVVNDPMFERAIRFASGSGIWHARNSVGLISKSGRMTITRIEVFCLLAPSGDQEILRGKLPHGGGSVCSCQNRKTGLICAADRREDPYRYRMAGCV
jgi:hypothetical protein